MILLTKLMALMVTVAMTTAVIIGVATPLAATTFTMLEEDSGRHSDNFGSVNIRNYTDQSNMSQAQDVQNNTYAKDFGDDYLDITGFTDNAEED